MNNKLRIIFMGTPIFSIPSLTKICEHYNVIAVYTQPPKSSGRGMKINKSPVNLYADSIHIKVNTPISFSSTLEKNILKDLKPDLIIVIAYGIILPVEVLNIPKFLEEKHCWID